MKHAIETVTRQRDGKNALCQWHGDTTMPLHIVAYQHARAVIHTQAIPSHASTHARSFVEKSPQNVHSRTNRETNKRTNRAPVYATPTTYRRQ